MFRNIAAASAIEECKGIIQIKIWFQTQIDFSSLQVNFVCELHSQDCVEVHADAVYRITLLSARIFHRAHIRSTLTDLRIESWWRGRVPLILGLIISAVETETVKWSTTTTLVGLLLIGWLIHTIALILTIGSRWWDCIRLSTRIHKRSLKILRVIYTTILTTTHGGLIGKAHSAVWCLL